MTISQGIIKVEELLQKDEDLAKRIRLIEKTLIGRAKRKYFISNA